MIIAITGTPGVGKTSVSHVLRNDGFEVVNLFKIAVENGFVVGSDKRRASRIVDVDRLDDYVKKNYSGKDLVFFEGHLSHFLKCVDRVIILRCHPDELRIRLSDKGWKEEKIKENIESELLDVILCETADVHPWENVFEIDTTNKSVDVVVSSVMAIINNKFRHMKKYNMGNIDWSGEILKDFLKK